MSEFWENYQIGEKLEKEYWWYIYLTWVSMTSHCLLVVIPFTSLGWTGELWDACVFLITALAINYCVWKYKRDGSL